MKSLYQLLWSNSPQALWLVFIFFLSLSALIAYIGSRVAIQHLGNKRKFFFYFMLILQMFTPFVGNIAAILAIFLLRHYQKTIYPVAITTFDSPFYIRSQPIAVPAYAEGWASLRLTLSTFSNEERKQALISLSRGSKRDINHIYRQLVSDEMEELRICAFSLLENQQNHLHERINELLKIYNQADSESNKGFYAKELALLYWELIYLNLGEKEFRKIILERCEYYADIANQIYQTDPMLLILLSRIAFANHDEKKGLRFLQSAQMHHAPNSKIGPYFAEQCYVKRDYERIKSYLSYDKSFRFILKLRPVVKFWCHHD